MALHSTQATGSDYKVLEGMTYARVDMNVIVGREKDIIIQTKKLLNERTNHTDSWQITDIKIKPIQMDGDRFDVCGCYTLEICRHDKLIRQTYQIIVSFLGGKLCNIVLDYNSEKEKKRILTLKDTQEQVVVYLDQVVNIETSSY